MKCTKRSTAPYDSRPQKRTRLQEAPPCLPWEILEKILNHFGTDISLVCLPMLELTCVAFYQWSCRAMHKFEPVTMSTLLDDGIELSTLQWAKSQGCPWGADLLMHVGKRGDDEIVSWVLNGDFGFELNADLFAGAAASGNLALVIRLRNHDCPMDEKAILEAAKCGSEPITDVALELYSGTITPIILREIAAQGWNTRFKKLMKKYILTSDVATGAARAGRLDTLEMLVAEKCPLDCHVAQAAAEGGHVHILTWLSNKVNCYPFRYDIITDRVAVSAATFGHLSVLKWYKKEAALGTNIWRQHIEQLRIGSIAAQNGHIHILEWLKKVDCLPLDVNYIWVRTLTQGQFEVAKWLLKNTTVSPWNHDDKPRLGPKLIETAACSGNLEMIQWIHQNKPYLESPYVCCRAVMSGNLKVLDWLYRQGYRLIITKWDYKRGCNFHRGGIRMLRWLREHNLPWEDMDNYLMNAKSVPPHIREWNLALRENHRGKSNNDH